MTVSHAPNTSRPALFDFTGRAKWDSWQELGKKYSTQLDPDGAAQARYLEIAKSLGWNPDTTPGNVPSAFDTDGEDSNTKGIITGTGVFVSTMNVPEDNTDDLDTIHGLAIAGDAQKLEEMLEADPSLDVDRRDDFVSFFVVHP